MISFACMPSGAPALTAARNMSPVESCTMLCFLTSRLACVPLPRPEAKQNEPHFVRFPRSLSCGSGLHIARLQMP